MNTHDYKPIFSFPMPSLNGSYPQDPYCLIIWKSKENNFANKYEGPYYYISPDQYAHIMKLYAIYYPNKYLSGPGPFPYEGRFIHVIPNAFTMLWESYCAL
jgi:hypothetical protein